MTRLVPALAICAAMLALGNPVSAGDYGVAVEGGYFQMSATNTASAVFGSAGSFTGGLALERRLGKKFFARVGARYVSRTGQQVFVASPGSEVFGLGHPLKLRLLPLYGLVGYRFLPDHRLVPYLGLGVGVTLYHEHSDIAGIGTDNNQTKAGGHFAGGLEYKTGRLRLGAEGMYQIVPNAIGVRGVSAVYDETDIGGFSVVGRVVIGL